MFSLFNRQLMCICACHPVLGYGCLRSEVLHLANGRRKVSQIDVTTYYLCMAFESEGAYIYISIQCIFIPSQAVSPRCPGQTLRSRWFAVNELHASLSFGQWQSLVWPAIRTPGLSGTHSLLWVARSRLSTGVSRSVIKLCGTMYFIFCLSLAPLLKWIHVFPLCCLF